MAEPQVVREMVNNGKARMQKALDAVKREFQNIRTGRASTHLVEDVKVSYYDTLTPLKGLANLSTPDPRSILILPWDATVLKDIERAIQASGLGLTPTNDGKSIRIQVPPLTEERRAELKKIVHRLAEEGKVSVRNSRHEINEHLKKLEKDKQIPEDEAFKLQKESQKFTDQFIEEIDKLVKIKEQEIQQV